ncbi:MAG: M23 family metallopeptidase [Scytonema sp. PMC 1069.18]|nr:M23 family metallopeptidase [Scytonema sp. PMC 1069.18]MEC4886439.1 M23 family metallopeptidase [Scytonema sp. PMC 1070.18]
MTQRNNSAENPSHQLEPRCFPKRRLASMLPAQGLCWLSSISMLSSGGLVFAQTESAVDNIVPTVETPQSATVKIHIQTTTNPESAGAKPDFASRRDKLRQRLSKPKASNPVVTIKKSRRQREDSQPTVVIRKSRPQSGDSQSAVGVRKSKPSVEVSLPAATARKLRTRLRATRNAPQPQVEASQPIPRDAKLQQEVPWQSTPPITSANSTRKDYNNAYIDPTEYKAATSETYEAPDSVVITERSTGKAPVASNTQSPKTQAPSWLRKSKGENLATVSPVRRAPRGNNSVVRPPSSIASANITNHIRRSPHRIASTGATTKSAFRPNRFIPNDFTPTTKVSAVPLAPSGGTLPPPLTAENVAPRPSTVAYDIPLASTLPRIAYSNLYAGRVPYNGTGLMFPLSIPAPITSLFGWRTHPITGDRRFHSGTDIGAAMGTPVLASESGQVEIADWVGGYGLTVVLNHNNAQQTLYGHMSEIFVQPGQQVEQGTVIGRVGSTGNSTGPHLHFEVRHLTPEGWVATDPAANLEYALNQLVQSLQTARTNEQSGS